jgi:hypothetical protein
MSIPIKVSIIKELSNLRKQRAFTFMLCIAFILLCSSEISRAEDSYSTAIYGALMADNSLGSVFLSPDLDSSYSLLTLVVSRKCTSYKQCIDFGFEGQIVKHFGNQDHVELNGVFVSRWLPFPWDQILDTSIAVGEGISFATEIPEWEKQRHSHASQLLNYLLFELSFSLPSFPKWGLIARIHHRSGVLGLFNHVHGASNALGLGLSYTF